MFEPTADVTRIHTMEDDITFERVRHLPRRTRVCSVHRQLSWACNKEIELYEKDTRVTTNSIDRSKTALQGRFKELIVAKKRLLENKKDLIYRRASCPAVMSAGALMTQSTISDDSLVSGTIRKCDRKPSDKDTMDNDDNLIPNKISKPLKTSSMNRAVSIMDTVNGEQKATKTKGNGSSIAMKRQQSMPAI